MSTEDSTDIENQKTKESFDKKEYIKCIGQCNLNDEYSHDFLGCTNCAVKPIKCYIKDCPCIGQGLLIPTNKNTVFSHQIRGDNKSIRIHSNRPAQVRERVLKLLCASIESLMNQEDVENELSIDQLIAKQLGILPQPSIARDTIANGIARIREKKKLKLQCDNLSKIDIQMIYEKILNRFDETVDSKKSSSISSPLLMTNNEKNEVQNTANISLQTGSNENYDEIVLDEEYFKPFDNLLENDNKFT